ncbi:MAG: serine O-acetyltransferase [Anaerolineales bacterium]|jgi:serine O-acetyltransferase
MLSLFRKDVQRWIVPQQIADPSAVTFYTTIRLLWQHMPLRAMLWYRFGSWCKWKGIPFIPGIIQRFLYRFFGLEITIGAKIGGGLYIAHPSGTVIAAQEIGENCSCIASVTIGMRNEWAFPTIGDNVFIGAGARILGAIHVGDNAVIGANAVVIHDVPIDATVVGIPAKVVRQKSIEVCE